VLLPLTLAAAACGSDHSPPPMRDSKPKKPVAPAKPAAPPSPIGDVSIRPQAVQRMLDPTVGTLADLPLGWQAWRAAPGDPWQRGPHG